MTPQPKKDGMIEDLITLGHEGSGNACGILLPVSRSKRVATWRLNLGGGWIPGRYE